MKGRMVLGLALALVLIAAPVLAQAPPPAAPAAPGAPAAPPPPPKVQPPKTQAGPKASVGAQFAEFELPYAFENKMAKFSDIFKSNSAKKLTVITFTNTTCAACQMEISVLAALKQKLADALQVVIVVTDYNAKRIADNMGDEMRKSFHTFLSDPYFTVPILHGFKSTPATVFVAPNGKILDLVEGFTPDENGVKELQAKIEGYLK